MNNQKEKLIAIAALQSGDYQKAIRTCRDILGDQPDDAEILHLLGVIEQQMGNYRGAIVSIKRAIALRTADSRPYHSLGNLLCSQCKYDEAIIAYRSALELKANSADLYFNIGVALKHIGSLDESIDMYEKALELNPDYAEAHNNLANCLCEMKIYGQAIRHALITVDLLPYHSGVMLTLGNIYSAAGEHKEALKSYYRCLKLMPDMPEAYIGLANVLRDIGRPSESLEYCRKAIELAPESPQAYINLGNIWSDLRRDKEAVNCYEKAVKLDPDAKSAYTNLGSGYLRIGRYSEAIECNRKAISMVPGDALAHNNLGNTLKLLGRVEEAICHYRKAVTLDPDLTVAYSNLVFCLNYLPNYDPEIIYDAHRNFASQYEIPLRDDDKKYLNDTKTCRRLKIGYVSADFRSHSVAFFIQPVIASHDKSQFEIYCYYNYPISDEITFSIKSASDYWREIVGISDEHVAEIIQADGIDILVDLGGHTGDNRLMVFSRKPAPVQVSWLGYLNTTGLSAMDYKITDNYASPPGKLDKYYSEKLIRLPYCQWCYDPIYYEYFEYNIDNRDSKDVVFCSFHNLAKITHEVIETWAEILTRVVGARLLMATHGLDYVASDIQRLFASRGVDEDQLVLMGGVSFKECISIHNQVDISLDSFPITGGTTTCHSLWMGVPVVTLAGETTYSRGGASLLRAIGMPKLIATSKNEYIDIAVDLAKDKVQLKIMRKELREYMRKSPVMDASLFCNNLEDVYRGIWSEWCSSQETNK